MDVITYFGEEKVRNLICIILGSLSIVFSLIFLGIIKYSFYKGMAVPLLVFGILQVVMGTIVYNRTATDMARVERMVRQNNGNIKTEELRRIQAVQENFTAYQWVEIILMLTGLFLYFRFYRSPLTFWKGLGLGLLLQAGMMLTLDISAEKEQKIYAALNGKIRYMC